MPHLAYRDDSGNPVYVDLTEQELVIGREADCGLRLFGKAVSRHHASIIHRGGRWRLTDAGSLHGTFLNRVRLTGEQVLSAGDQIVIGDALITFEGGPIPAGSTPVSQTGEAQKLSSSGRGTEITPLAIPLPEGAIQKRLSEASDREGICHAAVDLAMHLTGANRGVIALRGKHREELVTVCELVGPRREPPAKPVHISKTFVERLVKDKLPLIARDTDQDVTLSGAQSILRADIRSVLGVPLLQGETLLGYLYIDTLGDGGSFRGRIFRKNDLDLVGTIARLAAVELTSRE